MDIIVCLLTTATTAQAAIVDADTVVPWLVAIREVVVILAAVSGVAIGCLGLRTWRKQLKGNTEYELARRLLRSVYRVRNALQGVRNPLMSSGEIAQALKDAGKQPEEIKQDMDYVEQTSAVYAARWKPVTDALASVQVEALEGEVLWGDAVHDRLRPLYGCVNKLNFALMQFFRDAQGSGRTMREDRREEMNKLIYLESSDPKEDGFSRDLQEAVSDVETLIRPHLKI